MSVARHHADWLSLVEVSGPFVSLSVLQKVFPQGLEGRDPAQAKVLRAAYEEWQNNPTAPGKQLAWVMHVLTSVLGYPENQIAEGQALPAGLEANMPEMGETLRPDFALIAPAGTETADQPQLLIASYPAEQSLGKPVIGKHWKATPATRTMELLHGANVPLGLVTNGEHWMLVYAPRGETTGYASWYGSLWLDEPITLRAFRSLLGVRRFFGVAADSTLLALLKESVNDQQEVTDQLGYQVREAVEVLVQSFDALDKESNRTLLKGIKPASLYDSALTVMMRLVFLFSAEERGLLHLGKPLYDDNYAVSTLQEQLQEVADRYGEEVLERRYDAWAHLLATFRAVHGGIQHQDLLMQAYGGSLFDPDRFPFLEGRAAGSKWRSTPAEPLSVNNRVVLHLLNSLQRLRTKVGAGTTAETRRVSFRALGVEQIGHVYEGLLDHTAFRADEVVLGIRGTRSKEPEIALATLESLLGQSEDKLIEHLKDETGRSVSALRKELNNGDLLDEHKLLIACDQDEALLARLRPFAGLIRDDSFDRPWVVLPGSVFVTAGTARRSTGTHYTPPSLTEPIVQYTLEPLVYIGPADGAPREQWKLKSPKEILDLRVCDMAMGSGAFLVQACRYLAERLVEAWENEEKAHPSQVLITPDGKFSEGSPSERLVPAEAAERIAIARRVVADRCLYGVDINPMAVEMAKLSMWLITVDANRPFTFLDHAFKCGDSLLGITSLEQLVSFSLRPGVGKLQGFNAPGFVKQIEEAKKKREMMEAMPSDTPEQIAAKSALCAEAEEAVAKLSAAADVLLALELKGRKGKAYETEREATVERMMANWTHGLSELQGFAREALGVRHCFHWSLAFPEIIEGGGFHAFVGNPPFVGGQKITGALGTDYRDYLVGHLAQGRKGSADLCAYFFLRVSDLLRPEGMAGLLATNTIAQGGTREVGLDALVAAGMVLPRAVPSAPWPGVAALEVAHVWLRKGNWLGGYVLNGQLVAGITSLLTEPGLISGKPLKLEANANKSFQGSIVLGMGFVLTPEEAATLIAQNPKNRDCLFPYLNGEDLNSNPDQSPSRWVINFFDWPLNRSGDGNWTSSDDKQRKEWLRSGIVPSDYADAVAADYPDLLAIIDEKVKPERTRKNGDGEYQLRYPLYLKWWIYGEKRPALYASISGMEQVLTCSEVSKHLAFSFSKTGIVFSANLDVFPLGDYFSFALLQSSIHDTWARKLSSTLENRLKYSPGNAFETLPFPAQSQRLVTVGNGYYRHRQEIMESRNEGLTQIYNRFHNPDETASDIIELRRLHVEMDQAVMDAYDWQDFDLGHGFHETKQGIRFTLSEAARREVLDRLLALNHQRHAEEVATEATQAPAIPAKQGRKNQAASGQATMDF
ncbi:hypothetical protein MQE22_08845 [Acidithiobacillus sp. YTS05]|nr:hypothetical protein MQE22_08845 [Acidithiobacillus sp. YTS05]